MTTKKKRMKNLSHPGLGVKIDCLEPYGLSITEGNENSWCHTPNLKPVGPQQLTRKPFS